ncbi:hypothetical protein BC833DRAFT_598598 [Globomyces pollinis-pini]|nr:hypothetical protein BC833DRAFT_598598 [Globomyces pollinis-pini]
MELKILKFEPFISSVDGTFWESLGSKKINEYKLNDDHHSIHGFYKGGMRNQDNALPSRLMLNSQSFGQSIPFHQTTIGILKNTNTIGDFKLLDKQEFLSLNSKLIWNGILDGSIIKDPKRFNQFGLITFADLKKYKFYYWFVFPVLIPKTPFYYTTIESIQHRYTIQQLNQIQDVFHQFYDLYGDRSGFFLFDDHDEFRFGTLDQWDTFYNQDQKIIGFVDPSGLDTNPGWPLRNFLMMVKKNWKVNGIKVFCYRESKDITNSILIDVTMTLEDDEINGIPAFGGWELGPSGKPSPRVANLSSIMDPKKLADTAIDLNLKLMRWRILPSLDLDAIQGAKCLLLGAGTLGCYVGRLLLAWGIRNITFVDNGKVSFSNPVRQPLFTFQDCLDGGQPKADAAAKGLQAVFPGVNTKGYDISIPMPGHVADSKEKTKKRILELQQLIESHDAIFLLTDSRESRWLPTVLGAFHKKIVINAALGFDTFLVMRHGMRNEEPMTEELGCYFCNDVVVPGDSLSDRTLDQQCTVTRPGLSGIAGAIAVELLASIVNHHDGPFAKAEISTSNSDATSTPLGIVPHQIRGFLSHFNNMVLVGSSFDKCIACSHSILNQYRQDGIEFLLKAIYDPDYLEQVTGLAQMKKESDEVDVNWSEDDEI